MLRKEAIDVLILLCNGTCCNIPHQHFIISRLAMKHDLFLEWFQFCV